MKNRRLKLGITIAVAILGIGYVAAQSLGDVEYYKMAHQVVDDPAPWLAKKNLRIHGFVVPGSIDVKVVDQKTVRTFRLEEGGKEIAVHHTGTIPDTFKEQAEVVATGHLVQENGQLILYAKNGDAGVSAKCPSKYGGNKR